jgi:hypothetical protein
MAVTRNFISLHLEWIVLTGGLVVLALMNPNITAPSLCLFDALGIFCPGEGLGRSISFIFRGMWKEAWAVHPAGFFAIPIITGRIYYIINNKILNPK